MSLKSRSDVRSDQNSPVGLLRVRRQPELCAFWEEVRRRWRFERPSIKAHVVAGLFERALMVLRQSSAMPRLKPASTKAQIPAQGGGGLLKDLTPTQWDRLVAGFLRYLRA